MKYALRLSVHMLMGGMLFSVLLGRLSLTGFLFGAALGFVLCLFLFRFIVRIPMLHGYLSFLIVPIRHPGFFFLPLLCFAGFFPRVPCRLRSVRNPHVSVTGSGS